MSRTAANTLTSKIVFHAAMSASCDRGVLLLGGRVVHQDVDRSRFITQPFDIRVVGDIRRNHPGPAADILDLGGHGRQGIATAADQDHARPLRRQLARRGPAKTTAGARHQCDPAGVRPRRFGHGTYTLSWKNRMRPTTRNSG